MSSSEKALSLLRYFPRITLNNLSKLPTDKEKREKMGRGRKNGFKQGYGNKGNKARQRWPALGFEAGNSPITETTPIERSYNYGFHAIRQYPPMSLKTLQLLIDTGRVNPQEPIDLAALCNTKVYNIDPDNANHFGVNLTEEGMDCFKAKVNLEVQWASEQSIAAVERNGGVITTAYFDIFSVKALSNPMTFFLKGHPIPKRLTPPADCIGYYTDAANRGYLADPRLVAKERLVLAQKYGYELPPPKDETAAAAYEGLLARCKDPRQVFFGLEPSWVINLRDKLIFKPVDKELDEYYKN